MKQFSDSAGRAWTISLTIHSVKRVRDLLGVNLLEIDTGNPPLLVRLGTDIILICDVIYALIKPQADTAGVSDEQFGASLGGEYIKPAQDAFYGELVDFFQKLGRLDLKKLVEYQGKLIDQAVKQITTRIENLDLETELGSIRGPTSTTSPGSSA
jgi:hypothetical protein